MVGQATGLCWGRLLGEAEEEPSTGAAQPLEQITQNPRNQERVEMSGGIGTKGNRCHLPTCEAAISHPAGLHQTCPSVLASPAAVGTFPLLSLSALAEAPRHFLALQFVPLRPSWCQKGAHGEWLHALFLLFLLSMTSTRPALLWPQRAGTALCLRTPRPRAE